MRYLVLALLLAGCAASMGHLDTPSGGPEIMIKNTTDAQVMAACATWCTKHGFRIDEQTDNHISANTAHFFDDGQGVINMYQLVELTISKADSGVHLFGELHGFAPDTVATQDQREWMFGELKRIDETLSDPNGR